MLYLMSQIYHPHAKGTKYTIPITKYAKQKHQVNQSKQHMCHLNQENMPIKTPSMPSQSKEYAIQNTKYAISIKKYANQNTKYDISIKRIRKPKHQAIIVANLRTFQRTI